MARLVGINHVALEVDDVDEALAWYGRFFEFELRGRVGGMAFADMGDQFIALAPGRTQPADRARHFGLVIDDKEGLRAALQAAGVGVGASGSLIDVGARTGRTPRSAGLSRSGETRTRTGDTTISVAGQNLARSRDGCRGPRRSPGGGLGGAVLHQALRLGEQP